MSVNAFHELPIFDDYGNLRRSIIPYTAATSATSPGMDLGSSAFPLRNIYLAGNIIGGAGSIVLANNVYLEAENFAGTGMLNLLRATSGDNTQLNAATGKTIILSVNEVPIQTISATTITWAGAGVFASGDGILRTAADSQRLILGGGSGTTSTTGATIILQGDDFGGVDAGGNITLATADNSANTIAFVVNGSTIETIGSTAVTWAGNGVFSAAAAKIIPGVTSLTFRNNADSASNLILADAGAVTVGVGDLSLTAGNINFSAANKGITFNSTGSFVGTSTATSWVIRTNNNNIWSFDSSGNLVQDATNGSNIVIQKPNTGISYNAASGDLVINAHTTNLGIAFQTQDLLRWRITNSGAFAQDATNGGPITFSVTDGLIRQNADTNRLQLYGGSGASNSNGASLNLNGNTFSGAGGNVDLSTSTAAASTITFRAQGSSGSIIQRTNNVVVWTTGSTGNFTNDATNGGSIIFAKATTGVQLQSGANGRTGTFTLNGATPVTISNTSLVAGDMIILARDTIGGTPLAFQLTSRTNATGFQVTGTATDTSPCRYWLVTVN